MNFSGKILDLSGPIVMGVINVTPDSFSDGGVYCDHDKAIRRAQAMVAEGAALIDLGGESTRPGATSIPVQEELDRLMPVLEALVRELPVPVSVDTSKPEVMREVLRAGAGMINDVRALQAPGAIAALSESQVPVCLMHMQGSPTTMQRHPAYGDVVADIKDFLARRLAICEAAGISRERVLVDPGFGFGKTLAHNLALLKRLHEFRGLGAGLLVGMSRKSMIGALLDSPVDQRLYGSLAAAVIAAWQGAAIIRAHDVKATYEALQVCRAVLESV